MHRLLTGLLLTVLSFTAHADYVLETVAEGFDFPWSITFLPDGDYLLSMRSGELRRVSTNGDISEPLANTPGTYVAGQGGYFDILIDPAFESNRLVYLSYAGGSPDANGTTIMRATLTPDGFSDEEIIFRVSPDKDTPQHYGGKMLFLADDTLLLTTGDGFEYREAAQDKFSQLGKVLRLNRDGSVPADNPFANGEQGNPYVYSYGHRNPQGLALDTRTNTIYLHEHGPKGGDELNRILPGKNYGWPAVTHGINYSGAYVSPLQEAPGVTGALTWWVPSIAPSGLAYYDASVFPDWQGDLFVGALVDRDVKHLELENGEVKNQRSLFSELGERIREVRVGPDGFIYLLTDSNQGALIRVTPAN
ncbi:MAG: PQQ-dependent sugar dehydrogenase [Pseudomonadales bacterium]